MNVHGEYQFSIPPNELWSILLDSESLRNCIPGAAKTLMDQYFQCLERRATQLTTQRAKVT
jgi:carbon monoxide dehydrogenase subunit G